MNKCEWPLTSGNWAYRKDAQYCNEESRKLVGDRYYCEAHASRVVDLRAWLREWVKTR